MRMTSDNPQSDGHHTAIDSAIDRAVERMMHVDPRPGLQRRVGGRLRAVRPHASLRPRLALAAGSVAVLIAAVLLIPRVQPDHDSAPPSSQVAAIAAREPQPAPVLSPVTKDSAPRPNEPAAKSSAPAVRKSKTTDTPIRMPAVGNVFGDRSAQVSAANVPGVPGTGVQAQPPQAKPEAPAAAIPPPPRPPAQMANIRLEITITEQREATAIPPRTVTLLLADRENGHVRTAQAGVVLNVDTRAEIVRDGRVRVWFALEYRGQAVEGDRNTPPLVNQTVTSLLEDGKPIVVSQSADPRSPRSGVRVELKATILK